MTVSDSGTVKDIGFLLPFTSTLGTSWVVRETTKFPLIRGDNLGQTVKSGNNWVFQVDSALFLQLYLRPKFAPFGTFVFILIAKRTTLHPKWKRKSSLMLKYKLIWNSVWHTKINVL